MKNKILIIEDNEQNLYLMTFILENNGYEVVQAFNSCYSKQLEIKIKRV